MKLSQVPFVDQLVMMVRILVPVASFVARRQSPQVFARWKWARRGVVYGAIALPISIMLYSLFFLIPSLESYRACPVYSLSCGT